ncbi:hypothetical protein [Hahella ganghwensis]|uniref:hypothetical protein n=1 Tax=Hahella ganghwensis TaxID=286420 RepID=UPI000371C0EC|nr:hypothetical protein [Hahella ganghwensis]
MVTEFVRTRVAIRTTKTAQKGFRPSAMGICIGILILAPMPLRAEISGYIKSLWLSTETVIGERSRESYGLQRLRTTWRDTLNDFHVYLSYDLEWLSGGYLGTDQYELQQALQESPYWHLQRTWHERKDEEGRHGMYRGYLQYPIGAMDIRFGRQQLNWSRTFLWSSFDRFNPYNPLQIEPDERQGIDALQLIYNFERGDSLELVAVPRHENREDAGGLRYRTSYEYTDIDLLIADYGEVTTAGVAMAGQWQDAGWKFETTHNSVQGESDSATYQGKKEYQDLVISLNYTLPSNTTFIGEVLYRGNGSQDSVKYDVSGYLAGNRTDLATRYLGLSVRHGFEPFANVSATVLFNVDDQSYAVGPMGSYAPGHMEDLYLRAGLHLFHGSTNSEFGSQGRLFFGEVQWFF